MIKLINFPFSTKNVIFQNYYFANELIKILQKIKLHQTNNNKESIVK